MDDTQTTSDNPTQAVSVSRVETNSTGAPSASVKAMEVQQAAAKSVDSSAKSKGNKMGQPVNFFSAPADGASGAGAALPLAMMAGMGHGTGTVGAGMGAGLGAGLVGGLLGGLLFGRRGLDGTDGVIGGRAAAALDGTDGMAIIAAIGNVKDTVNAGTASVTAAVTNGNMMLTNAVTTGDNALMGAINNGFAMQNSTTLQQTIMLIQQLNAQNLTTMQELCNINQNVSAQGCQTREAVVADGNITRSLLSSRFQLEDATEINKLNAKVIELQNEGRSRELGERISINNTAVAAQQQGQQQQQQQQLVATVNSLFPLLQGVLQVAHATNSNVIAGNTGAVTTGAQTASPTNVNA